MSAPLEILDGVADASAENGARYWSATKDSAEYTSETSSLSTLRFAVLAARIGRRHAGLRGTRANG